MDMTFEVIHRDERQMVCEREGLGVGDADQQRSGEARTGGDSDGVEVGESEVSLGKRSADHRNDGAQMLAACQFGHHSAIARVRGDLRGDHGGDGSLATLDDGRGGLVAGSFDAEDEAGTGHTVSLVGGQSEVSGAGGASGV
ncbi:hypothetical protein SBA5_520005 [Candidatus Sulfotelmatomonas gaucii]|uniref:Uncharacterized protein n=1 Tax=Candidatus Sulfuritelmatomonas gaucii TaxID=2043161 RepID=A0A2N9LS95_9BACT|nr:hypothetical protein SBA5_520005 [Candidatus Sulfotelmatomonas gaucii]